MSLYSSVKNVRISEKIAKQIKGSVLEGTFKPGDRLPAGRKLVEHFEASPAMGRLYLCETTGRQVNKATS